MNNQKRLLDPVALGVAAGIIWGATVFLATIFLVARGGTGETIGKLARIYPGYTFSYGGAFVGLVWGFVDALITGWVFGLLYNLFARKKPAPAVAKPAPESPAEEKKEA